MKSKFSQNLYLFRKQMNLTQRELAESVGVSQKSIDFWEKDINEPKATSLINLAKFFGVTVGYLLGVED